MRIRRLEHITHSGRSALRLHQELTIVTGLGRLEREALSVELIGAVGPGRPGLCVDLSMGDGSTVEVVRPLEGDDVAIDSVTGADRSARYRPAGRGPIDPLGSLGLERHRHRSFLRVGRRELLHARDDRQRYEVLADVHPGDLWATAEMLVSIDARLRNAAAGEREAATTAQRFAKGIEDAHANLERRIEREMLSDAELTTTVAALAVLGLGAAIATSLPIALPFFGASAGLIAWRGHQGRAIDRARQAERVALARASVSSYLDYQLRRVDVFAGVPERRASTLELIEQQRRGLDRWHSILGGDHLDITPQWVLENRAAIEDHRPMRHDTGCDPSPGAGDPAALVRHLDRVKAQVGESLPLLLDDPFAESDDFDLTAVLSMLDDRCSSAQIVLMTDDPRIVGWGAQLAKQHRALVVHLGGEADPAAQAEPSPDPVPEFA